MARSRKKGIFVSEDIIKKLKQEKKSFKTHSRASTIIPSMIGCEILVYNGKKFIPVKVNSNHVGYKLGDFSLTRTLTMHSGDKEMKIKT